MSFSVESMSANWLGESATSKNAEMFILVRNENGMVEMKGNMEKEVALQLLQREVNIQQALELNWYPEHEEFPRIPLPLPELLKNPNLVKSAAGAAIKRRCQIMGQFQDHRVTLAP